MSFAFSGLPASVEIWEVNDSLGAKPSKYQTLTGGDVGRNRVKYISHTHLNGVKVHIQGLEWCISDFQAYPPSL